MRRTLLAATCLVGFALCADPPAIREGLWSIHTVSVDNPGDKRIEGTRSLCRNHAYDVRIREQAQNRQKQSCKSFTGTISGNRFTQSSECTIQGSVVASKGVTTFSGDTSTHTETHTTFTPALYGIAESAMTIDQKYLGACPAGMAPGDYMSSDGKVTHVQQH